MTAKFHPAWRDTLVFENYGIVAVETDRSRIRMSHMHMHPEIEMNLLLKGSAKYFFRDRIIPIPSQQMIVFWATTPHCLFEASKDVKMLIAKAPLDLFLQWQMPEEFAHALMRGIIVTDPNKNNFASDCQMIHRWESMDFHQNPMHQHLVLMELEARLFRLALNFGHSESHRLSGGNKSAEKVALMLEFMGAHHREQIRLPDIAKFAGINHSYATTLFKKVCGINVQKYLIQLRLSHAESDLVMTDKTVTAIALDVGFASPCQFYAEFKKKHNLSPGAFREKIRSGMLKK